MNWSFNIPCPDNILWWLICICIIGVMISAAIMLQAGRFSLTRDGQQVSIQRLHLTRHPERLDEVLRRMNNASRNSLRRGLRGDFLFMPFFYALLIFIGLQLRLGAAPDNWQPVLRLLCYLPLATWGMDLVENFSMLGLLANHASGKRLNATLCWTMAGGSLLKWISGIAWLLITTSLLIAAAVS